MAQLPTEVVIKVRLDTEEFYRDLDSITKEMDRRVSLWGHFLRWWKKMCEVGP